MAKIVSYFTIREQSMVLKVIHLTKLVLTAPLTKKLKEILIILNSKSPNSKICSLVRIKPINHFSPKDKLTFQITKY
jgi:hypothetical protein